jgi:hypothetical protein
MTKDEEVLLLIGSLLINIQSAERIIDVSIAWALADHSLKTTDDLFRLEEGQRRRTIGQLFSHIKKNNELDENVNLLFERFLDHRNIFVHRLRDVPGFDLDTTEGLKAAQSFLTTVVFETQTVIEVFSVFIHQKIEAEGLLPEMSKKYSSYYDRYVGDLLPFADIIRKPK